MDVGQDSDELAVMVGHYKQEIAMLEAQVKHLRDVHHEAALKLTIEGAEMEVNALLSLECLVCISSSVLRMSRPAVLMGSPNKKGFCGQLWFCSPVPGPWVALETWMTALVSVIASLLPCS